MTRLRYNGLRSTLGGSGLTSSATSIPFGAALTHSGGTAVPTIVSPDFIPLSLIDSITGLSEIVHLTAYTTGATSGTIIRGREGTTGVSHTLGDSVVGAPTVTDFGEFNPRTPGSKDDEFDGLSSVSWSNGPTAPTTWDINTTAKGFGYLRANGSGTNFVSVIQAVPGSYPFTITAKVNSTRRGNTHLGLGLVMGPASPTTSSKILYFGPTWQSSHISQRLIYNTWAATSFVGAATANVLDRWGGPAYLRFVVTSATNLAVYASMDGVLWTVVETGLNPGFTPGVMGLGLCENGTADLEGVAEFFRVT